MRRVTTPAQDRFFILSHLRDRRTKATHTANITIGSHGRPISDTTVRSHRYGLRARRPVKGIRLTPRHRQARLTWARAHLRYTRADWVNVLFTDESRFKIDGNDGRDRIYRRVGERYADNCVFEGDRYGGATAMIWAGISFHTKTPAVVINGNLTARKYCDDILNPVAVPHILANRGMQLMQDGATSHTARLTQTYLARNRVNILPWPSRSPDLNPIEHLWDLLDRAIRGYNMRNRNELQQTLISEWNRIQQNTIQRYIVSMRSRCLAVIRAGGGHTRY